MQQFKWCRLLAVGALLVPLASRAQGPQPKVREIATFPGANIGGAVYLPNGRIIIYAAGDSLLAYDPATKRSTFISRHFDDELSISRDGDRIVYTHRAEDGNDFIWSIPIDPNTGAPTAPAQRVSMSAGDVPSLSPDGKLVAFALWTARGNDLAVVPATGGPERVLAGFARGIGYTAWSADGKWILIDVGGRDSIQRVPAAGGRGEKVISYAGRAEGILNEQIAMFRPDLRARAEGRIAYATSSGMTGAFLIPPGARWTGDYMGVPSQPKLLANTTRPEWAHSISWVDGKVRELRPSSLQSRGPAWSPDGRQLALHDSTGGLYGITVMNADGSRPRHYPVSAFPSFMRWAPNGQTLAYSLAPPPGGTPQIGVLDLATGSTQIVSTSPNADRLDCFWRPDGKSLVVLKIVDGSGGRHELWEAYPGGTERKLRDIDSELPGFTPGGFISDRQVVVGSTSSPEHYLVSTVGGTTQKLPRGGYWRISPGVSKDGKWLAFLVRGTDGRITSVDLVTARGDSLRTLPLPFQVDARSFSPPFHPDGRHLILFGKKPGESVSKIFSVPLDGSAPRELATLPTASTVAGRLDLSPDGMTVVFTSVGAPTSKIYELDLSSILRSVGKP